MPDHPSAGPPLAPTSTPKTFNSLDWLQQLINSLALGSIYALIALGYTMVYGVLRFINFAHSDVLMLGAFAAFFLAPVVGSIFPQGSFGGAIAVVVGVAAICALIGIVIELFAYRPLRQRPKLTVLITAIGVSLFIEYTCQHKDVFGASKRSFPALLGKDVFEFWGRTITLVDVVVLGLTVLLLGGLWFVVHRTRIGTAMRAVSFNPQAAALVGVNINRVISFTFGLGSALAGVAGVLFALRSSNIDPLMGIKPGLFAFVAAVLGGIGNLPGAVVGGLILGLLETLVGGIDGISNYRDGIAFAILVMILIFKPAGLLGELKTEKV